MRKIIVITDSTNDLSKDLLEKNNIKVVPLCVNFGNDVYRDGIDIVPEKLYEEVEKRDELPKTSAVSPAIFFQTFKTYLDMDYDIIYTGIGSKISSTFQNATIASQQFPENRIFLIDSLNLSSAIGLLLLKICKFRDEGLSAEEITIKAKEIVPKIRAQFSVAKLDFLHKGGRCTGTKRFFGTMLRIKPIIRVKNGTLDLDDKAYGKYEKALDIMINDIAINVDKLDEDFVMITHTMAHNELKYIQEHLPQEVKDKVKNIFVTEAGCVISSHCGKRTIGILYILK